MDAIVISPLVIKNFSKKCLNAFLYKKRLFTEYTNSGKGYNEFLQENINDGKLSEFEFEEYLYDDLLFGNQRLIYMHKICSYNKDIRNKEHLLEIIQKKYTYIQTLYENKILLQPYNTDISELVGVRVVLGLDGVTIHKINLIFSEKCEIVDSEGERHNEFSYITIDVDFIENLLFVKVKPKSQLADEKKKPEQLANKYLSLVVRMLKLSFDDFIELHKNTLCNLNIELYEQIYNKMVQTKPKDLAKYIEELSDKLVEKLDIKDYMEKIADNNIFNIEDTLNKMVEHVLISNIIYDTADIGTLENVDGYASYIKFSDGSNISARIKSENCIQPIFASEAFMALRSSINNGQKISILKVYWLNEYFGLRVSYDASDSSCLNILIYKSHSKEEFEYAIKQYRECESRTIRENPSLFAMEA